MSTHEPRSPRLQNRKLTLSSLSSFVVILRHLYHHSSVPEVSQYLAIRRLSTYRADVSHVFQGPKAGRDSQSQKIRMNEVTKSQKIYDPIGPYTTRLIRLHSDNGSRESPLSCDLYPADILHPTFEGFGIRSTTGEEDSLVEFDALSYTWGDGANPETLLCNGVSFPISRNLSEALREIRRSKLAVTYLWVDAICINQRDDEEKSTQVRNMMAIYQKASRVIA